MSNTCLREAQERVLAHGPNYAVVPRCPPITECVAVVEHACHKLNHEEAEEL